MRLLGYLLYMYMKLKFLISDVLKIWGTFFDKSSIDDKSEVIFDKILSFVKMLHITHYVSKIASLFFSMPSNNQCHVQLIRIVQTWTRLHKVCFSYFSKNHEYSWHSWQVNTDKFLKIGYKKLLYVCHNCMISQVLQETPAPAWCQKGKTMTPS